MKKFRLFLLAFATIMFPVTMVSCGDDEPENPEEPTKEDPVPASVKVTQSFSPSEDFLELYNLSLIYFDGKENQLIDFSGKKTVEVTYTSFPATFGVTIIPTLKEGVTEETLTKEQYNLTVDYSHISLEFRDSSGKVIESLSKGNTDLSETVGYAQAGHKTALKFGGVKLLKSAYQIEKSGSYSILDNYWENH